MNAENAEKSDRSDLSFAVTVGALVVAFLVYDGIRQLVELFETSGAVTVRTRVPEQEITVAIGSGAPGTVDLATLVVSGVNSVSVASLVVSIVASTSALVAAAVLGVLVCRRLFRGIVFDATNTRLTFWMSMSLLAAGLLGAWFENMGLNGVFAALGGSFDDGRWLLFGDAIPLYVAAIAVGVLVIVFRRGAALQKETEGLV
ncbi:hypothetical protein [Microbacterium sp. GXF0217]